MHVAHVEPHNGIAAAIKQTPPLVEDQILLLGRDPQVRWIADEEARNEVQGLIDDGRRLVTQRLDVPTTEVDGVLDTLVSAVQLAVWFEDGHLMAAMLGKHTVNAQRWGQPAVPLSKWPGVALDQLTTLWLPLSNGTNRGNLRWRIGLACTGPERAVASSSRTGVITLTYGAAQEGPVIERYRDLLSFPARTYAPKLRKLEDRPSHDPVTRDYRLQRIDELRAALDDAAGLTTVAGDHRVVTQLLELDVLGPKDVIKYAEHHDDLDLSFLQKHRLLR